MGRLAVALFLGSLAAAIAPTTTAEVTRAEAPTDEEAVYRRLEPQMAVAGLRLEEATLEEAMRRLGQVDREGRLKGSKAPSICYVGPDGTRLGLGFAASGELQILRRFELAAPGVSQERMQAPVAPDRPTCLPVKRLPAETGGRLRLGMTKAEVISLLGTETGGADADSWTYAGSLRLGLSPAQREILAEAGVSPEDLLVQREVRLEFRNGRLVAIRAAQRTRGRSPRRSPHSPRYAFRTSGLSSSSRPLPCMTMDPVSST